MVTFFSLRGTADRRTTAIILGSLGISGITNPLSERDLLDSFETAGTVRIAA